MASSWFHDKMTRRHYRIDKNHYCIVQNEYQTVRCFHCDKVQYCRLTQFEWHGSTPDEFKRFWHTNYRANLDEFKGLAVQNEGKEAITEQRVDDRWVLIIDSKVWATEFEPGKQQ